MGSLPPSTDDLILTTRGAVIENTHAIHAAIVSSTGTLLHAVGNPSRLTLARSAAKPAQALAILETGAFDQYNFSAADLALICSSHSSEERHIDRARAMLARISDGGGSTLQESDLRCGGHAAMSEKVNREWIKKDFVPGPLCNNCSGKHVGMLAGALALGADTATYHLPDHPMQVRVRECVADMCGLPAEQVAWAVDGCNLPAPACPLRCLARNYALVAEAADVVRREGLKEEEEEDEDEEEKASFRAKAMGRIFDAMVSHPEMVAGEGRFCTVLMEAFGDTVIGKLGADACYGVGVRASGRRGALGIAVKIEDGNEEILYAAVAEILEQLQIGTVDMRQKLAAFHHLSRVNTAGAVTGKVSFQFKVRAVSGG